MASQIGDQFDYRYIPDLREIMLEAEKAKRARGVTQTDLEKNIPAIIGRTKMPPIGEVPPGGLDNLRKQISTVPTESEQEYADRMGLNVEEVQGMGTQGWSPAATSQPPNKGVIPPISETPSPAEQGYSVSLDVEKPLNESPATELQPGEERQTTRPGFWGRLGEGLKAALHEGLTAVKLGAPGYKALQLQKELYPMQEQMAKTKYGLEQTQAEKDEAIRKRLIEYQQQQEQQYAPAKTPAKETVSDLQHSYLMSLPEAERNALLKRSLMRGQTLAESIDELTGNEPAATPTIKHPATPGGIPGGNWFPGNEPVNPTPLVPGSPATSAVATPVNPIRPAIPTTASTKPAVNPEDKAGIIQLLKEQGFNDIEIADTLKDMGY